MGSLTESLAIFKTNHETTTIVIVIINMRLFWTLWILVILLFCERVGSEKRIAILTEEQNNQELVISKNSCRFAQLKCSYRTGCGSTLQSFIIECDGLIHNKTNVCSETCKNTLVGLTSTLEGQKLMTCNCDADSDCEVAKLKIEACRDSVTYATRNDTVVSCTEARWICLADAECGKALEYYHLFCRSMFRGKACSERCKNSLNILRRQEKAAKLSECQCEANEKIDDFLCKDIKENMNNLCIEDQILEETTIKTDLEIDISEIEENLEIENEIDVDSMPEKTSNSENLVFKSKSLLIFSVYGSLLISSVSRFC